MKEKIKPIYAGLLGLFDEAPKDQDLWTKEIWEQYNNYLEKLHQLTSQDYGEFEVTIKHSELSGSYVQIGEYRSKLNGLIRRLYYEYFTNENNPFITTPNTQINLSQQQSQSQHIVLEIQSLLDKKLYTGNLDEKEKSFIGKVKEALPAIKNIIELLNLITTTAKNSGLDIHQLTKIFGH